MSGPTFLPVDAAWTAEQCLRLVLALSPGQELSFFDPDFPSVSDPGGYVRMQRGPDGWLRKTANHGWSTLWEATTPQALAAVLHSHRTAQGPGVQLGQAHSPAKEGEK